MIISDHKTSKLSRLTANCQRTDIYLSGSTSYCNLSIGPDGTTSLTTVEQQTNFTDNILIFFSCSTVIRILKDVCGITIIGFSFDSFVICRNVVCCSCESEVMELYCFKCGCSLIISRCSEAHVIVRLRKDSNLQSIGLVDLS